MDRTITRADSFTNERVRVVFHDGSSAFGQLKGWGTQIICIAPDYDVPMQGQAAYECHGWKRHSFGVGTVDRVEFV